MKNFFAIVGLLVVVFVGVGIWQGWFKFAINSDNKVTTEFDANKASADGKKGWETVQSKLEELKKKDGKDGTEPTSGTPANTPGPVK